MMLRIGDDKYRGDLSIQHTVYDMQKIIILLKTLDKYSPNQKPMRIRDADLSKRPTNTPDEALYAAFINDFARQVNNDTQDTVRKNIFPDLHRMGLIDRYNNNLEKTDPYNKISIKYVSLSDLGVKLISEPNELYQKFIWSKALDTVLGGLINTTLSILNDENFKFEYITKIEYMFFVSAINAEGYSFKLKKEECIDLISEFRGMSFFQIKQVIMILHEKMVPGNYTGNKTNKRDFHNWRNKNDRIFERFQQTVYFQVFGDSKDYEKCSLSTKTIVTKAGKVVEIRKRSLQTKIDYLVNHNIKSKSLGYELHHVVALSLSESPEQYDMFDKWQNLVYIDAYTHAIITQNRNRNVLMTAVGENLVLSDYYGNKVDLIKDRTILYDVTKQPVMLDYNEKLRTTIV